jgi:S1-C subfamily serine protease
MAIEGWLELSRALVETVGRAAAAVVRVDGRRRGSSSGVVWSPDGSIVTAHHGVEGEEEVEVGLPSGETVAAEVVGRDPSTDLALLRARAGGLVPVEWSDDPLAVGQLLLGVTRPGRGPRAALGMVSRLGDAWRTGGGGRIDRYVEIDLAPHPGFSGGLVLDLSGRAVGLAMAGLARGTPLALPAATVRRVIEALLAHGAIRRGYLGVATLGVRLPPGLAEATGSAAALLVSAVEEESPAARAGLSLGDLLVTLDDVPLHDVGDLLPLLDEERIGHVARARIARGGALQEVAVTIGARGGAGEERP